MADFGGLGGVSGGRSRNHADDFESAVEKCMGDLIRSSERPRQHFAADSLAARLWGTMANGAFKHDNGDTASYSFRAAGDLIASIRGQGDYMDWYCSAPYDLRDPEVLELLAKEGWHYDDSDDE